MTPRTLSFRLIASSIVWVAVSLLAAGSLLVLLFRNHIERRFDARLQAHVEELVAASDLAPAGALELGQVPSDPLYNRPLSGWYWQIEREGNVVARSESLWRNRLEHAGEAAVGSGTRVEALSGPEEQRLRALVGAISLPGSRDAFVYVVAGPRSDIDRDVARFGLQLLLTMGVLGLGLVGAVLVQVRFGLRPLRTMQRALAEIRAGGRQRLPENPPAEVEPVVHELNSLLDHNAAMLERYRTQTANLAHGLKNPLTVIGNEIRALEGKRGELLREQTAVVSKLIDRHLSRARAAASGGRLGARASVAEAVDAIRFSMDHLYRDRQLEIRVEAAPGLAFQGDPQDLEEMLGNLVDNACKWARRRVRVDAAGRDGRLCIQVGDDGPGIPAGRCEEVLARGRRLDSRMPGSGLGLGIVQDVAELYGGSLALGRSPLGGALATLELPAAD